MASAEKMSFPFEINDVPEEVKEELMSVFSGETDGYSFVGPKKYLFGSSYRKQACGFYNMDVRPDDVWVVTFPRSGTTWTQEMVWLINNDLDYQTAQKERLTDRFPFLDHSILPCETFTNKIVIQNKMDQKTEEIFRNRYRSGYHRVAGMKSPRHIKSHLPLSLLPPKLLDTSKVIYVARNPKDVAVSFYHFSRHFTNIGFEADFKKYWELFERNLIVWGPFWSHVEEAWKERLHPNMLFLFYEDMKKDLKDTIKKVAEFLSKSLNEEEISKLAEHLSFENISKNPALRMTPDNVEGLVKEEVPGFFRKGESGTWKAEFNPELNEKADKWIKENEKRTDLKFLL